MKNKFYFITICLLILLPLIGLAETSNQSLLSDANIKNFDLNWSTDTYTSFGYEGRALPVRGGLVFVDAEVSIFSGDAKNLKYSWFLEDIFQKNKSGYGKTSFYFYARQTPGTYHTVRVQVFNEDRTIFQEKTIKIPIVKPEIILSLANTNKLSIIAKPYFFSINKLTDLVFEWTLEGQNPIKSSDYDANILDINILNKHNNQFVEQELRIGVENSNEKEQKAYDSIKINL